MRRLLVIAGILLAAVVGAASGAPKPSETAFVLSGGGWGHGVGMSQWGAFGQAKAGRGYAQILDHYYRGTELGTAPAPLIDKLRVLVAANLGKIAVSSSAAIVVIDGTGQKHRLPGEVVVEPSLELPVGKGSVPVALSPPLTFRPTAGANLVHGGKGYRGEFQVTKAGERLQLVNALGLEAYLLGVVPGEMPKDWPLEALKAQAVAARTYAVAHLVNGKGFDLYSDWRSQLYYGVSSEAPGPSQAVRETRGQILTYEGKAAQTFYFSSSGGRTISSLDAFGSDFPYLVAVDDPWDEESPNHAWATQRPERVAAREAVRPSGGRRGRDVRRGHARQARRRPARDDRRRRDGRAAERRPREARSQVDGLPARRPPARPSGRVAAEGRRAAHGRRTRRQRRGPRAADAAGSWVTVKRLAPAADGTFAVKLRLAATTVYRLAAAGLGGPPLTVRVAA